MGANRQSRRNVLLVAAALVLLLGMVSPRGAVSAPLPEKKGPATIPVAAKAPGSKVDLALRAQTGPASYFVVLNSAAATGNSYTDWAARGQFVYDQLQATADDSQASLRDFLQQQQVIGMVYSYRSYWIVNAFYVSSDSALITQLASRDDVAAIWANGTIRSTAMLGSDLTSGNDPTDTATPTLTTLSDTDVNAEPAWDQGYTGQGIVIASLDSGVAAQHPALAVGYRGSAISDGSPSDYSFFDAVNHQQATGSYDDSGQGTFLLGAALGSDGGDNRIGVAPDAHWIAAKVLDSAGMSSDDRVLDAMQWILAPTRADGSAPRPDLRPRIALSAWGSVCADAVERQAVQAWVDAGILPIFAGGNNGAAGDVTAPAAYPESFSVGALDPNTGTMAEYSSAGQSCYDSSPRPQLLAPGSGVISSLRSGGYGSDAWAGSGLAAAQVAGAAAVLLSARPDLNVTDTAHLLSSSGPVDNSSGQPIHMLDVSAILGAALISSPTPTATDVPPTATEVQPTATDVPPTATEVPATATAVPPTATEAPPTETPTTPNPTTSVPTATNVPPTATDVPLSATPTIPTATAIPPTASQTAYPPYPPYPPSTSLPTATGTAVRAQPSATSTPVCSASFRDVPQNDWSYPYVRWLFCRGAVSGYADGNFRPLSVTTRAQFAKMITLVSGWTPVNPATPSFSDVPRGFWAYPYIETVRARHIVDGYNDGTYRPLDSVTRGQLAKMLVVSRGWQPSNPRTPTFADVGRDHWAYVYVETAAARGIITGYRDDPTSRVLLFRPDLYATRAQLAKMLYGAFVTP